MRRFENGAVRSCIPSDPRSPLAARWAPVPQARNGRYPLADSPKDDTADLCFSRPCFGFAR
jgi:hypothetical protein